MKRKGFTIVELLIVIVVIAILAVITVVAYDGIQKRAQNTTVANTVSQYVKGLSLYAAEHGTYGRDEVTMVACLDGSTTCWGSAVDSVQTAKLKTALESVMGTLPPLPASAFTYTVGNGYYIVFTLADASDCPAIGGTTFLNSNLTSESPRRRQCRVILPNPA